MARDSVSFLRPSLNSPVEQRAAFLAQACAGDEEVRERVEAMLAADAQDDLLMDRPAYQAVHPRTINLTR